MQNKKGNNIMNNNAINIKGIKLGEVVKEYYKEFMNLTEDKIRYMSTEKLYNYAHSTLLVLKELYLKKEGKLIDLDNELCEKFNQEGICSSLNNIESSFTHKKNTLSWCYYIKHGIEVIVEFTFDNKEITEDHVKHLYLCSDNDENIKKKIYEKLSNEYVIITNMGLL